MAHYFAQVRNNCYHVVVSFQDFIVSFFEIFLLIHLDCSSICNYVKLIQSMVSTICLLFLFVASITSENAFVHLRLIPVLLGAFVLIIGVVQGGANIVDAIGVSKWFTIEGARRGLALKSPRFT